MPDRDNAMHPASSRLALATAKRSHLHSFGLTRDDRRGATTGTSNRSPGRASVLALAVALALAGAPAGHAQPAPRTSLRIVFETCARKAELRRQLETERDPRRHRELYDQLFFCATPETLRYTLTCEPSGGTLPDAGAACQRLAAVSDPFAEAPIDEVCTQNIRGRDVLRVTGFHAGRAVGRVFTLTNGCNIQQFDVIARILGLK